MNKFFLPTLAVIVSAAPVAQAQNLARFERSFEVSGALQTPEGRRDINRIAVDLNADGTATLRLSGRGNGWWSNVDSATNFTGRWYGEGRDVTIDLDKVSGRNVFGTATLRFDSNFGGDRRRDGNRETDKDNRRGGWGNGRDDDRPDWNRPRLEQITIAGRTGNGGWNTKTISGTFQIDDRQNGGGNSGGGNNGGGEIRDLFTTKRGNGKIRINNNNDGTDEIRSAKVELNRDGDARITLEGKRTWFFEGSWRQTGRERIALSLDTSTTTESVRRTPGFPNDNGLGSGEIVLDGLSLESLSLSGRRGNEGFNVNFSVRDQGRDDSKNDDTTVFLDRKFTSGFYKGERTKHDLNAITVQLQRNQVMKIEVDGAGRAISLRGKWIKASAREYIANVNGDGVNGTASVIVDRDKITSFSFIGRDRDGRCTITNTK